MDEDMDYQKLEHFQKHSLWGKAWHYVIYIILLGGRDVYCSYMLELSTKLKSGGALMLCIVFFTCFCVMPITGMETFFGRYTRKTNGQMHKMVPLFIGFSLLIMIINLFAIPLETTHISIYLVDFVSVIGNTSINSECFYDYSTCYNYRKKGPIKVDCHRDKDVIAGMVCDGIGVIRYPMQQSYWDFYRDPSAKHYPFWKLCIAQIFLWFLIWLITFLRLRLAGIILFISFVIHSLVYCIILIFSLIWTAKGQGMHNITSVDLKHLTLGEISCILMVAFRRTGLLVPMGHMTFSSRLQQNTHNIFNILFNLVYGIFLLIIACAVSSAIAQSMGTDVWNVTITDFGYVQAMIPEFLVIMSAPFVYVMIVYFATILKEIVVSGIGVLMFLFNLFDFFPSLLKFEKYIKVIICVLFFIGSTFLQHPTTNMKVHPSLKITLLLYGTGAVLLIETIMVFYLYGINRFSDDFFFLNRSRPNTLTKITTLVLPIILGAIVVVTVTNSNSLILESQIREYDMMETYKTIKIIFAVVLSITIAVSIIYLAIQLGSRNACERVMKPDFFWGPINRPDRMNRKTFSPSTLIRSQPLRVRKYRTVLEEDITKAVYSEDKWKIMKDIDDLEKALKGTEEDDTTARAAVKTEEQMGRIFSDTQYFGNLQNISHVAIKTSGKVMRYEKDEMIGLTHM